LGQRLTIERRSLLQTIYQRRRVAAVRGVTLQNGRVVTISITADAYAAIEKTLPKGAEAWQPDGRGGVPLKLERKTLENTPTFSHHLPEPRMNRCGQEPPRARAQGKNPSWLWSG
jgi:hypothetical protein